MSHFAPEPEAGRCVFLVDDDPVTLKVIGAQLRRAGYVVQVFTAGDTVLQAVEDRPPDAIVLDISMEPLDGMEVLRRLRLVHPEVPVLVLSGNDKVDVAVECMRLGAFDYEVKPADPDRLAVAVGRGIRQHDLERRVRLLEGRVHADESRHGIIGESWAMRQLFDQIARVRDSTATVLIQGETGTGKELVARALHFSGARRNKPFVSLNCGALTESLQESELFGHERGAFTGAQATHRGKFEQAQGGTLFLDEVGELSPSAQVRLLRVLQQRQLERVGGSQTVDLDVRIVCATHRELQSLSETGAFRSDLYYRLAVFPIVVPSLRERIEDIPVLTAHFMRRFAAEMGHAPTGIDSDALDYLCAHTWPGNVRELENVMHRAMLASDGATIGVDALPAELRAPAPVGPAAAAVPAGGRFAIKSVERDAIVAALERSEGNVTRAAKLLGIGRSTLHRKLRKYGLRGKSAA